MAQVQKGKWMVYRVFEPAKLRELLAYNEATPGRVAKEMRMLGVGVARSTVHRHAKGDVFPDVNTLAAYAGYFMVPFEFFFREASSEEIDAMQQRKDRPCPDSSRA